MGICAALTDAARNPERLDAAIAFGEVARVESLGDLPLIVVTAADHPYPGLDPSEVARLNQVWDAGQAHWAGLSTSSELVPVEGASHDVHLDRPDLVTDLAGQLLPTTPLKASRS
jgi:pimeloyl-ACP methyl ester carboxylesterase